LKELKINKVYLFDPQESSTKKLSNGTESEVSSMETVQLYEQFEACSIKPPKPIPYNLKRIHSLTVNYILLLVFFIDPVFYIFTSGTTGLPKAAVIKHARL
jgi:hypothetical protein